LEVGSVFANLSQTLVRLLLFSDKR
jgi:hypothetical protein